MINASFAFVLRAKNNVMSQIDTGRCGIFVFNDVKRLVLIFSVQFLTLSRRYVYYFFNLK